MLRPHPQQTRRTALQIMESVERGAHADQLLDRTSNLSKQDARLLREIVLGTITWRARIDFHLNVYLKRPVSKQKSAVRNLLRLGAYQILFLDRVPAYAIVSEAVEQSRRFGKGVSGMVNAVLRGLAEERKPVTFPDASSNPVSSIAAEYSYPEWLVRRWLMRYGLDQTKMLCDAGNTRPTLTARVNRKRASVDKLISALSAESIEAIPSDLISGFVTIPKPSGLFDTEPYRAGWFSIQGLGAARVCQLLKAEPGHRILDVCAAPGGKAMSAAEQGAHVFASDVNVSRLRPLVENRKRLGLTYDVLACDARALPYTESFDQVIVDAPCTGLGTLSRHPEIRWHRSADDIPRMTEIQQDILKRSALHVRPGGTLVYSTCTIEPDENEQVVENFLQNHDTFSMDDISGKEATVSILPDIEGHDGAFGVRFRKVG